MLGVDFEPHFRILLLFGIIMSSACISSLFDQDCRVNDNPLTFEQDGTESGHSYDLGSVYGVCTISFLLLVQTIITFGPQNHVTLFAKPSRDAISPHGPVRLVSPMSRT